jgi:hypothetical protein
MFSIDNNKLISADGQGLDIFPHEYWYLAPSRTNYKQGERVSPLDFAFVLHNASIGQGKVISPENILDGIEPQPTKRGVAAEAELLLEKVRKDKYPHLPSRLRSYFLNNDRAQAELRAIDMFRGNRTLVRCYIINGGRYHYADVSIYEQLEGRPDDIDLANKYWQTFKPSTPEEFSRLEVLADSSLYFPDWQTFPRLDFKVLTKWNVENKPPSK